MRSELPRSPRLLAALLVGALAAMLSAPAASAQGAAEAPLTRIAIDGTGVMFGSGSLSPDGRWIVLSKGEGTAHQSLWMAPAAGGEPFRLTDAGYDDASAVWSPTGDRIFFTSTRPARGEPGVFIMTLRIDPQSGRALDAPRQVTLERGTGRPAVSPDGRTVAYIIGTEVRVVPAMGGNSRVVATVPRPVFTRLVEWAPQGDALYYMTSTPGSTPGFGRQHLFRIALTGGPATEVLQVEGPGGVAAIAPAAQRLVVVNSGPGYRERTLEVMDFAGRTVASRVVSTDYSPSGFSADGRTLLVRASEVGAIMRVRPVAGGEPIDLSDGSEYDWPVGWTADSRSVIVTGDVDGSSGARILPLGGGTPRVIRLPADEPGARMHWGTPTHVTYRAPRGDQVRLVALDLATGARTVLSENAGGGGATGPGGLYRDTDGFVFTEVVNGEILFRSAAPGRPSRTFFRLQEGLAVNPSVAFQGDRVAYYELVGDSVGLMLIDAPAAAPRLIATLGVPARPETCCRANLSFSHDGSWIVAEPFSESNRATATLIRVPAQGRATEVRNVTFDAEYWYEPRWTPDNRGFTVIAGAGRTAWVAFVPTEPGQSVRHLSRADDRATWGQEMSPDGRFVAYPAEVWHGSSFWRMEIR
jgi:Tol biopolymer transport system component